MLNKMNFSLRADRLFSSLQLPPKNPRTAELGNVTVVVFDGVLSAHVPMHHTVAGCWQNL